MVDVALGYESSLFLTSRGLIFGCGRNKYGQLFLTPSPKVLVPTRATLVTSQVSAIKAGDKFAWAAVGLPPVSHPGMRAFGVEGPRPDATKTKLGNMATMAVRKLGMAAHAAYPGHSGHGG
jgi:hypothetical protein